jgi:hypothetical protein
VLSRPSSLLRPPPTPSRPPAISRIPVIGKARSRSPQDRGQGGPLQFPRQPSDRSTSPTPEGSSAPAPGPQAPSMAFAKSTQARHPLFPAHRGSLHDAADFASRCGPASCSTPLRPRPLNRTRRLHYRGPWRLPGPDSHRLAIESLSPRLRHDNSFTLMAPGAAGRTWIQA